MSDKNSLVLAAPSSGSGKTVITLALLRAFRKLGYDIGAAKAGPDYIDPAFHRIACGTASVNLDPWAMSRERVLMLAGMQPGNWLLVEAMMGLYDGAADGTGSAAELSKQLGAPVVLVVNAAKQSHSIAALVRGFRDHDPETHLAGVILNRVGSPRHADMLKDAMDRIDVPVLGAVPNDPALGLPERHLGLVQAEENPDLDGFIDRAANIVADTCDLEGLASCFGSMQKRDIVPSRLRPPGKTISVARDVAFSFIYPHLLADWKAAGCEISFFSPLADEPPKKGADAVYLPGGYPELHAEQLSNAEKFKQGMHAAAEQDAVIYGECGGYMVLGDRLITKDNVGYPMLGLLRLETSFAKRKLHLGYRNVRADNFVLGRKFKAHEFHYTVATKEEGEPLFEACDATGTELGSSGLRSGSVMGSYMHLIDQVQP